MTKRIFRSVFLASLVVFLAGLALVVGALYNYFTTHQAEQLRVEAQLAAHGVELSGLDYFDGLDDDDIRLTWIAADGTVIYDTDAEAGDMENHAEREEFREALQYGYGEGERTSNTLSEKTVYYAIRLTDGSVLRTAESHYTVPTLLLGIIQPLLLILLLALLLSAWLASRLSKRIVGPLNAIDLDKPLENEVYDELSPPAEPRGASAEADNFAAGRAEPAQGGVHRYNRLHERGPDTYRQHGRGYEREPQRKGDIRSGHLERGPRRADDRPLSGGARAA